MSDGESKMKTSFAFGVLLKQRGYSSKAIKEIWKWYDFGEKRSQFLIWQFIARYQRLASPFYTHSWYMSSFERTHLLRYAILSLREKWMVAKKLDLLKLSDHERVQLIEDIRGKLQHKVAEAKTQQSSLEINNLTDSENKAPKINQQPRRVQTRKSIKEKPFSCLFPNLSRYLR